jgi:hypothetical protein
MSSLDGSQEKVMGKSLRLRIIISPFSDFDGRGSFCSED